jgi:hypothetical protein
MEFGSRNAVNAVAGVAAVGLVAAALATSPVVEYRVTSGPTRQLVEGSNQVLRGCPEELSGGAALDSACITSDHAYDIQFVAGYYRFPTTVTLKTGSLLDGSNPDFCSNKFESDPRIPRRMSAYVRGNCEPVGISFGKGISRIAGAVQGLLGLPQSERLAR